MSLDVSKMSRRARVRMGAAELDIVRPGWFNDIDPSTLDLESSCNCVLAQLDDGDYSQGCQEVFGVSGLTSRVGTDLVAASGFVANDDDDNSDDEDFNPYDEMTAFWKQEIRARKRAKEAVKEFNDLAEKLERGEISRWG